MIESKIIDIDYIVKKCVGIELFGYLNNFYIFFCVWFVGNIGFFLVIYFFLIFNC